MHEMLRNVLHKIVGRGKSNDGDQLTGWVLGMAQIFGHWPFTNRIGSNRRMGIIRMTVFDCLRLSLIIAVYLIFMSIQMWSYYGASHNDSTVRRIFSSGNMLVHLLCIILSVLISCWNRHDLLKILSINRKFDREVSSLNLRRFSNISITCSIMSLSR